jgi:prophage regulatory protein
MKVKKRHLITLPEIGYVRIPQILSVFPVSEATWWIMVKNGKAPKPVKLGPRITAWKASEIREFIGAD